MTMAKEMIYFLVFLGILSLVLAGAGADKLRQIRQTESGFRRFFPWYLISVGTAGELAVVALGVVRF
jgi:hypothetical protein